MYIHFAEERVDQQPNFFMGSLGVDSLCTSRHLEETIDIAQNQLSKESETIEGLTKSDLKDFFPGCYRFAFYFC